MSKRMGMTISLLLVLMVTSSAWAAERQKGMPPSGMPSDMSKDMQNKGMMQKGMHNGMSQEGMRSISAQGSAPLFIDSDSVVRIQEKLNQQPNYTVITDGIWGRSTARALRGFQESQGLAPTGNLNIETIQALELTDILSGGERQQRAAQEGRQYGVSTGTHLYISPASVRRIQQNLDQEGYDIGKADGIWGPKTQQALRQFQQDKGMAPTGNVNLAVIESLGLGQIVAALTGSGPSSEMTMGQTGQMPSEQDGARGYFGKDQGAQKEQMGRMNYQMNASGQGAPLFAGPDMVVRIQQALSEAGHDPGSMDGTWNQSTKEALQAYQKEQNLDPTGTLTVSTVHKLVGGFEMEGGMGTQPSGTGDQPSGIKSQPTDRGNQPSGMGNQPSGMGNQPSGMGNQPSGMDNQPSGMDNQPSGMGSGSSE